MAELKVATVKVTPFSDMKPGTSGLRKSTRTFMEQNYTEAFVECVLDAGLGNKLEGSTVVVGGDGRFYNNEALQKIIGISAANKVTIGLLQILHIVLFITKFIFAGRNIALGNC